MAKAKLTAGYVGRIKPEDGEFHWDTEVKGFGLRVRPTAKTWVFDYRLPSGKQGRFKIGPFAAFTADEARLEAKKLAGRVAKNEDPSAERDALRRAATMRELAADYLERHAKPNKSPAEAKADEARLARYVLPKLGGRKAADVTRRDVEDLHRAMQSKPYAANRVLALLSKMFSLAVKWGLRPDNPVKGIERNAEARKEAWLSDAEIQKLLAVLRGHANERAANAVRLLLLTGARMREVLHARWEQFDLAEGTWTKPAHTTKQKKLHHVRLSAPALALLKSIREAAEAAASAKAAKTGQPSDVGPFVFPGGAEGQPLDSIKRFWAGLMEKAELGAWEKLPGHTAEKPALRFRAKYRIHDLRHTVASHMVTAGTSLAVVKEALGHTQIATTMRYAHLAPSAVQEAADRFGAKLTALAETKPAGSVHALRPDGAAAA